MIVSSLVLKQILMPYCKQFPGNNDAPYHHVLYVMNKYRGAFDVLDSFDWAANKGQSKSAFHAANIKEIVSC